MSIEVFDHLRSEIKDLKYKFFQFDKINLNSIKTMVDPLIPLFQHCIIIGFGASSLNIKVLASLKSSFKKVTYLDNMDMVEVDSKLDEIPIGYYTLIFSISRSGNTVETSWLTEYMIKVKKIDPKNIIIIAPSNNNSLFHLHKKYNTKYFEHPIIESGRFGIISSASLLPAYFLGVDINKIINYSISSLDYFLSNDSKTIIEEAAWYIKNFLSKRNILILWNYSHQLKGFCLWQRQMLAESLGKNGYGVTPVISSGSFDEHSQFQLYLDGPQDKFYKILYVKSKNQFKDTDSRILKLYKIFEAASNKPIKLELFEEFNEQLISLQIIKILLTTMLIAKTQNIDPLNQPAIEFIKIQLDHADLSI